jgi:hypothetical protein
MKSGARLSFALGRPTLRKVLSVAAWLVAGVVLTLIFLAYRQPGLLTDLVNLRYCG